MAQHKAPTAVTLAPTTEKSGFAELVERTWKPAAAIAVVLAAAIIYWDYSHQTKQAEDDLSWEKLMGVTAPDANTGILMGRANEVAALAGQVQGTQAGPWALFVAANSALAQRQTEQAQTFVSTLKREYPSHPLVTDLYPFDGQALPTTQVAALEKRIAEVGVWVTSHAGLYQNPALPENAPRVRLNTDRGAIVVGLYSDRAPKHVENFLKLVREGYYTGTRFHAVIKGSVVQGGDPNTIQGNPESWGKGGPDYKLDFEQNDLKHFAGFITALNEPNSTATSGSQFSITTGDVHGVDGQGVVFGRVLEGMDIVFQIETGSLVEGTSRPADPVTIQSAEAL